MFSDAQREFLQKKLIARMSTIDENGYPHTVPVWFMLDGDDIVVYGISTTRKISHMRANPKGCIAIGGDLADGTGYLLKGEWTVEPDNDWSRKITYHYEGQEHGEELLKEWGDLGYAVMRLKVNKVIKV